MPHFGRVQAPSTRSALQRVGLWTRRVRATRITTPHWSIPRIWTMGLVLANRRGNILERSIMDVTKRPIGQETHGATSMEIGHNAHRPKIALLPLKPGCGRHVWHLRQSLLLPWNVPDARKEVHPPQDRTILPHGRWSNHFQNVYPNLLVPVGSFHFLWPRTLTPSLSSLFPLSTLAKTQHLSFGSIL